MRSTLAPGEDYATATALLGTEDLHQETVRIWDLPIRVRGLSLVEREEARATCWRADGQRDQIAYVKRYLQHGIVVPQLNSAQIDQFVQKHAWAVESVYLYIDRLTELPYELVVAQALALASFAPGTQQDNPSRADSADDRPMDRSAGPAGGDAPAGVSADDRDEDTLG